MGYIWLCQVCRFQKHIVISVNSVEIMTVNIVICLYTTVKLLLQLYNVGVLLEKAVMIL